MKFKDFFYARVPWMKKFFHQVKFCMYCSHKLKKQWVAEEETRRHVCPNCKRITYINPKVVAGLIPVNSKGEVILLKRNNEPAVGKWTYPAGYMEMGETVEAGAVRESIEEIGVKPAVKKMIGVYSYDFSGAVTVVYEGKVARKDSPKPTPEAREVRAFPPNKIPWKDLAFESTADALKDWKKNR